MCYSCYSLEIKCNAVFSNFPAFSWEIDFGTNYKIPG